MLNTLQFNERKTTSKRNSSSNLDELMTMNNVYRQFVIELTERDRFNVTDESKGRNNSNNRPARGKVSKITPPREKRINQTKG